MELSQEQLMKKLKDSDLKDIENKDLLSILEESNFDIHTAKEEYGGHRKKVDKSQFVDKINQAKKKQALQSLVSEMNWDQRYQFVLEKKQEGNLCFKEQKYQEANELYLDSLIGLIFNSGNKMKDDIMKNDLQLPILLNIASCLIKMELYKNAIIICDKAIEIDDTNHKAYCKRGIAHTAYQNYDEAKRDYLKSLKLTDNEDDKKDITKLYKKMETIKISQQKRYKHIFTQKKDENSSENNKDADENQTEKENNKNKSLIEKLIEIFTCKRKNKKTLKNNAVDTDSSEEEDEGEF